MGTGVSVERTVQMHRFVTHLQVLAGNLTELPASELLGRFDKLANEIPNAENRVEQLAIDNLLAQATQRLGRALSVEPRVAGLHPVNPKTFREAVRRLRAVYGSVRPRHIAEFAQIVGRRYAEPDLSAAKVAAEMRLSACHLTRILRRHTGHGFLWHLHTKRIEQATELLAHSIMSVKEISACAGYVRTSQFDRRFNITMGMTPSAYRAARRHQTTTRPATLRLATTSTI